MLASDSPPLSSGIRAPLIGVSALPKDHNLIAPSWQKGKENEIAQMGDSVHQTINVAHQSGENSVTWPQLAPKEAGKRSPYAWPGLY